MESPTLFWQGRQFPSGSDVLNGFADAKLNSIKGNDREFKSDAHFPDDRVLCFGMVYNEVCMATFDQSYGRAPPKNR